NSADSSALTPTNAPASVALADINNDGIADLVVLSRGTNVVQIFEGLGGGTFSTSPVATLSLPQTSNAQSMVVSDLTGDNLPDIAVADTGLGKVSVLINGGNFLFGARADYSSVQNPVGIVAGDFNGDAKPDLAVVSNVPGTEDGTYDVSVLSQDFANPGKFINGGTFNTGLRIPTGIAVGSLAGSTFDPATFPHSTPGELRPDLVVSAGNGVKV